MCNVMIRTSTFTREKRLMIDIAAVRETYENQEIGEVGWIQSGDSLADAFTKVKGCPALETFLHTGVL